MDSFQLALETFMQNSQTSNNHDVNSHANVHSTSRPPFQVRNLKLDFSRFDGTNGIEWIFKTEQFFDYYHTPDIERLTVAAIHMDKEVVPWFQMMLRTNPFHSWQALT